MKRVLILLAVISAMSFNAVQAQNYRHSVGAIVGYYDGFNYKGLFGNNFALDATLAYTTREDGLVINPAALYQAQIAAAKGLSWFAGGGIFGGFSNANLGFIGFHAMGGLEYKFNIPLALSFDFRPGVGIAIASYSWYSASSAYFSWPINLTARYTF